MKIWILNLIGLAIFGVLIEILLPNGKTNKYIKGVLSLVIIYVIISPVASLLHDYKFGDIKKFFNGDIDIDYEFVSNIQIESNKQEEKLLEEAIKSEGIENVKVHIVSNLIQQKKIEYVKISINKAVITGENPNINIKEVITKIVCNRLNIDEEKIYYE